MIRLLLIMNLFVMWATVTIADDNTKALALLKGVEQERLKYDCFHIRYEEHRTEEGRTVEQIVDFDRGNIRKEHLPNSTFHGIKSILLEDVVYYMATYNGKHVAVVPHKSTHAYGSDIYDPRMLGLIDMMSHTGDVSKCFPKNRHNYSVSHETLDGRPVYVVKCSDGERNGFALWKLYIEEPGFQLIRKTVEAEWGKIQIDNDYSEQNFLPFPTKIHIYRVSPRKGGEEVVVFDRHITVKDVQIKPSFSPETFTLAGLNPPLNSDVVDYRINRRLGYWDGEKLVDNPVSMSAQEFRELMAPAKSGWFVWYFFMGTGIVLIFCGLYLFMKKRGWIK